jgi:hypothetical protein
LMVKTQIRPLRIPGRHAVHGLLSSKPRLTGGPGKRLSGLLVAILVSHLRFREGRADVSLT